MSKLEESVTLAKIVRAFPGVICSFRLDPDGAVILTEPSEIESFLSTEEGRLPKEISLLETLLHPKDSPRVLREIQDAGSHLTDWQSEFRLKPAEKGVIWIKSHFIPARQDDGSIVFDGVMFDITKRKKYQQTRRKNEYMLKMFVEHAPAAVAMFDKDMNYLITSKRYLENNGISDQEIIGRSHYEVFPDLPERWKEIHRRCLAGAVESADMDQYPRPDGQMEWVQWEIHPWYDQDGVGGIILFSDVITEEVMANQLLQYQHFVLSQIGKIAKIGGWEIDPQTGEGNWSEEVAQIHDLDPADEMNLEQILNFYHGESRELLDHAIKQAMQEGKPYDLELEMISAKGAHKWVHTIGHPFMEEGRVIKVRGSFQEITERKKREEEIKRLNEDLELRVAERTAQLQAVNKELESFAYSVSHDLKAPLRGIDGYSQLLMAEYEERLDQEGRQFLQNIRSAANQMTQLIDDLLKYSRLERRTFSSQSIRLASLIEALLAEYSREIDERGIEIRVDLEVETIHADPEGLSIALRNLIDNAVKYTRKIDHPVIRITGRAAGDSVLLTVEDNGAGFSMQYKDRIFEIFERLYTLEEFPGTGIGLALVSKAVKRMGGKVWAESEPGNGAQFHLQLPQNA